MTTKKVAHYFSDHSITVVSDAPLSEILHNIDATGRVAKWAIELLPLDIKFEAKKAIKSQAIADSLPSGLNSSSRLKFTRSFGPCSLMALRC